MKVIELPFCKICRKSLESRSYYSLKRFEYLCPDCFKRKLDEFSQAMPGVIRDGDLPCGITIHEFIDDIKKDLQGSNAPRQVETGRSLLEIVRDRVWDLVEKSARERIAPGMEKLFPTRLEMAEKYNSLLKKLLTRPDTGLPYFIVSREMPGEDYLKVPMPGSLEWIFSMEKDSDKASFWVDRRHPTRGVKFFQIISASCTGITNLIDLRELADHPNFIVSERQLRQSGKEEGPISKFRRLSLQALAPIFCTDEFNFSPEDITFHARAVVELSKIPAADRWRKAASGDPNFREILYIMSLLLDRYDEFESTYYLLNKIFAYNRDDERMCFHRGRLRSRMKDFDLAIDNIEMAVKLDPQNQYFKSCRHRILEKLPVEDPIHSPGCPDMNRIFGLITGELDENEGNIFQRHIEYCPLCKKWYEIMKEVQARTGIAGENNVDISMFATEDIAGK
ncbi:MAG: hypothetical protein K8T10_08560 [Candidatus Eremiobacteraeota bacterium]|nr:hypothetical protein [Candidatus Eremiobacteraeota bacterium]